MSDAVYQTFWLIDGQRCDDFAKVERAVDASKEVVEVPADQQRVFAERQLRLQIWQRQVQERAAKITSERQHARSPAGLRQQALRTAAENPGGLVSVARDPAFDVLDRYSPERTNRLR